MESKKYDKRRKRGRYEKEPVIRDGGTRSPRQVLPRPGDESAQRIGTVDGYWGLLKRGIIGSYHQISVKHLSRYVAEFQLKWNNRRNPEIFMLVIAALVIGSALPYEALIADPEQTVDNGPECELDGEPIGQPALAPLLRPLLLRVVGPLWLLRLGSFLPSSHVSGQASYERSFH